MSGIESWSTTPASNNQSPPFGWPAGILPSQVEPIGRQMMTSLAAWYQAAEWINYNFTPTYVSATQFTMPGNVTPTFHVGRRVQATDGSTSVYGTITVSAFTTLTTVTVVWDSGVLQTGVTIVYVGIASKTNSSAPLPSVVNAAGNWAIPAASSGSTLAVSSVNGATAVSAQNTTSGAGSNLVLGVTNLTDADCNVTLSQVGAASKFANFGPGTAVALNLQTGGVTRAVVAASNSDAMKVVDDGGTLQTVGFRDAPQRILAASDAPGFADRGKQLYYNTAGGSTLTIPANASVALPIGFTALIVNGPSSGNMSLAITTDSLFGPSGVTGTRTIAPSSMATVTKITATAWMVAGSAVT